MMVAVLTCDTPSYAYKRPHRQQGAALLITLILVMILSLLAAAASTSNQLQEQLNRSQQEQHNVFNASFDEIQLQLRRIQDALEAGRVPDYLAELIREGGSSSITLSKASGPKNGFAFTLSSDPDLERELELHYRGTQQEGACLQFEFIAKTGLGYTFIVSHQHQVFLVQALVLEAPQHGLDASMNGCGVRSASEQLIYNGSWWEN